MVPDVWRSSPARIRRSVDFPQPLGPTMQRNSPGRIFRSMSEIARMRPAPLTNSLRTALMSIAAPRRSATMLVVPAAGTASAAARQLTALIFELEWPKLLDREIDVARVHEPLSRKLLVGELLLYVPGLDVEHAGGIDVAVGAARRP